MKFVPQTEEYTTVDTPKSRTKKHKKAHSSDSNKKDRSPKPPQPSETTYPKTATPMAPPNPQVYVLPTEEVKLVFPDDDETQMAANLKALDRALGRPSDLHAIILESGEDADTFSRQVELLKDFKILNMHLNMSTTRENYVLNNIQGLNMY